MFDFSVVRDLSRKITVEDDPKKIDAFLSDLHDIVSEELGAPRAGSHSKSARNKQFDESI